MSSGATSFPCRRLWIAIALACVLLKFWLVAAQPVVAIGPAGHDDRLYLQLASNILEGQWLGDYSHTTLVKGPMYPLWIAATVICGIPLPIAQHLLYLVACLVVVRVLRSHLPSTGAACALFLLLWWNPMTFEAPVLGRVLRQNFYTPVALLLFAGAIALETRRHAALGVRVAWGCLLGFSGAALWLTREESVWAAPSVVLLIAAAAWVSWRNERRLRPLFAPLTAATLVAGSMMIAVCTLNLRYYGWFGTVEFRSPAFIAAYGSLQRIVSSREVSHWVPVTREAREKAYAVSPAFAELQPHLEGAIGTGWARASEPWIGLPPAELEMGGGWFMWALRDAALVAGHSTSARSALDYYQRIADEVNAACDAGLVPARPRRDTLMPPWRSIHTTRLVQELPESFAFFFTFRGFTPYPPESVGSAALLRLFSDMTRWRLAPSPEAPDAGPPLEKHQLDRLFTLRIVGKTFRWIVGGAAVAAVGFWAWLVFRACRTRAPAYPLIVATAALGGSAAVVIVNTLVHVLSFPNRSTGSFAQAYPWLILFTALIWFELLGMRNRRLQSRPAGRPAA